MGREIESFEQVEIEWFEIRKSLNICATASIPQVLSGVNKDFDSA